MNEKVSEIVNRLFETVAMNDEIAALREEILNNCQERYRDLIENGMSESEALDTVRDSLAGMEEMLSQFPGNERRPVQDGMEKTDAAFFDKTEKNAGMGSVDKELVFDPRKIRCLDVCVGSADLLVRPAQDGRFRIEKTPDIHAEIRGETLVLNQETASKNAAHVKVQFESFSGVMRSLTELLQNTLQGVCDTSYVNLYIPQNGFERVRVDAASGDIDWNGVPASEACLTTISGDIDWDTDHQSSLQHLELKSRSGDIEVRACAVKADIGSVSGDAKLEGAAEDARITTVSGDVDLIGSFERTVMQSTSGDLTLELKNPEHNDIRMKSVSGDCRVILRGDVPPVRLDTGTVSGDTDYDGIVQDPNGPLHIQARTVSGDIEVSR